MKKKSLRYKKLSSLLALALKDLEKQEKAKNSIVNMWDWLSTEDGKCVACAAGAVMRFSLGKRVKAGEYVVPCDFDSGTADQLYAIDFLREGAVKHAAEAIGADDVPLSLRNVAVTDYATDRDQWWADMRQLLADLKAAGM